MRRFRSILAVYDACVGSEAVLEQAVTLARTTGAHLTLVNPVGEKVLAAGALEDARRRLPRIVPWITREGVKNVATSVLVGPPHLEILREVERSGHDLVILSAEAGRSLKDLFCGSTALNLMRKCPCALWVIKTGQPAPSGRILAAVGPNADDTAPDDINRLILERAAALARAQNAELHIVHAWTPDGADAAMLTNEISDETREAILCRCEATCRTAVNALLADRPIVGMPHQIHLPRGLPQQSIVHLAERLAIDLIVMGAASRSGISRLLVGNASETVLGAVRCGVLTVRPEYAQAVAASSIDVGTTVRRRAAAGA